MDTQSVTHLSTPILLRETASLVGRSCRLTGMLLVHLSEVQERQAFRDAGYPSMHTYCVGELHFTDSAAYKRIHGAHAARRVPVLFDAVAENRLHLSAVLMLAPKLTDEDVDELVAAATHKTKSEIELIIATKFPVADVPTKIRTVRTRADVAITPEQDLNLSTVVH